MGNISQSSRAVKYDNISEANNNLLGLVDGDGRGVT